MTNRTPSLTHSQVLGQTVHLVDRAFADVAHGRFERSLSGLTAVAAAVTVGGDLPRALQGQLRQQVDVEPDHRDPAGSGRRGDGRVLQAVGQDGPAGHGAGLHSQRPAGRVLPHTGRGPQAGGLAVGLVQRADGAADLAPGLMTLVGGMGLLAALLRRED